MKTDTPKGPRRSQQQNQDENYIRQAKLRKRESSKFLRTVMILTILIIGGALSFFILADNQEFLEEKLGKDNFITRVIGFRHNNSHK